MTKKYLNQTKTVYNMFWQASSLPHLQNLQHGMLFKRQGHTFFRAHFMHLHGIGKSSGNLSSVVIVCSRSPSSIWYPTFSGFSSMDCSKGEWYHKCLKITSKYVHSNRGRHRWVLLQIEFEGMVVMSLIPKIKFNKHQ